LPEAFLWRGRRYLHDDQPGPALFSRFAKTVR
jgi:hypothetical protein